MSKVIIIPDMHQSRNWEKAKEIAKEHPDYFVVGLGDWVDSGIYDRKEGVWRNNNKWPEQGENLKDSLEWFSQDKEHRFFCLGNHDWSYLTMTRDGTMVSGHQSNHTAEIRAIFNSYKDILHIGKEIDGWVFSHAGFTKYWVEGCMIPQLHRMLDKWPEEDDGIHRVCFEYAFALITYYINGNFWSYVNDYEYDYIRKIPSLETIRNGYLYKEIYNVAEEELKKIKDGYYNETFRK